MIKEFLKWISLKEKLHGKEHIPPFFKEGEIWWCHFGENVGTEMNGKGDYFTRPVLILKKYDKFSFMAVPLTTKDKKGTWYYTFIHNQKTQTAVLAQSRVINYKRIKELVGKVDSTDFKNIKKAFIDLHK
jgi:mRNA interferase MazF